MLPIIISVAAVILFAMVIAVFSRFKKCPPDRIMVVYGTTGKSQSKKNVSKCIHGGATFVLPVFQGYGYLDLTPMQIDIPLQDALSSQNIRVNVPSTFTVRISEEPGYMENAAINFLGLSQKVIEQTAEEIIYGQLRGVIATMTIEDINADRQKFMAAVSESIETELEKVGLKLINVNIKDITDSSGYIEALGRKAAAEAVNRAKVDVAEKERDGAMGTANAQREQRISVSRAEAEAVAGEKEAERQRRIAIADRDAEAVEGENLAEVKKAQSESERRQREAEAERAAIASEKVQAAAAQEEAYAAEKKAEDARAIREEAKQKADVIVPANIAREKQIIEAEAQAEQIRREQQGVADGEYFRLEADAKGRRAVLEGIAEGLKAIVSAADGDPEAAARLMVVDKITELTRIQVEALENIKVDKLTVWEGGSKDGSGQGSVSNVVKDLLKSVPPLASVFEQVGMEIPGFLGNKKTDSNIVDLTEELESAGETGIEKYPSEDERN